jgi:multidrug efflux pump subunit AcrA (membrane-fusion protein)
MKKYVMLFTFTAMIAVWLMVVPLLSAMSVREVTGIKAVSTALSSFVNCTGSVVAARQQTVDYGYAIKPSKLYVKVGDTVAAGQKLMDIDQEGTLDAFHALSSVQDGGQTPSTDYTGSDASLSGYTGTSDLSGLLSQYGVSDTASSSDSQNDDTVDENTSVPSQEIPHSVCSDISGIVTQVNADENSFTQPAAPLIVISDLSSIQIKAQVDESMIAKVRVGQSAVISGLALNKNYSGKVAQIYPAARTILTDQGKETVVDIILSVDNAGSDLKPGLNTNIEIHSAQNNKAIVLPYSAVGEDNANVKYVYIADRGRAIRKNIITGNEYADTVEIVGGIKAGDTVISNPSSVSKNGIPIKLKNTNGEKHG